MSRLVPPYVRDYWIGIIMMMILMAVGLLSLVTGNPHPLSHNSAASTALE